MDLLKSEYPDKEIKTTPMRKEVDRCRMAVEETAAGKNVAMVCSGDPGVYGMAGLCYEVAQECGPIEIEVIPASPPPRRRGAGRTADARFRG